MITINSVRFDNKIGLKTSKFFGLILIVKSIQKILPFSLGYAFMQGYVRFNGIVESWILMQAYVDNLAAPHNKQT